MRVRKYSFTPNRYGAADDVININYRFIVKRQGDVGTGYTSVIFESVPGITPPVKVTNLRMNPCEGPDSYYLFFLLRFSRLISSALLIFSARWWYSNLSVFLKIRGFVSSLFIHLSK